MLCFSLQRLPLFFLAEHLLTHLFICIFYPLNLWQLSCLCFLNNFFLLFTTKSIPKMFLCVHKCKFLITLKMPMLNINSSAQNNPKRWERKGFKHKSFIYLSLYACTEEKMKTALDPYTTIQAGTWVYEVKEKRVNYREQPELERRNGTRAKLNMKIKLGAK